MTFVFPNSADLSERKVPLQLLVLICSSAALSASMLIGWTYLSRVADGRPPTDGLSPLYWEIPNAGIWILLFPFIYYIVRRNPLKHGITVFAVVSIQGSFALLFAAIHLVCNNLFSGMLFQFAGMPFEDTNPWCPWTSSLRMSWRILFYSVIVAVCYAVEFFDRTRIKKLMNSRLEARIQATRLKQMKIRIDPVFVQRTLSDVASLMQTNTRRAVDTIARLGAFFRLIQIENEEISLAQHVRLLRSYFRVETERSEGRIRAIIRLDRELAKIRIPNLPLQSLVHAFYRFRSGDEKAAYKMRLVLGKTGSRIRLVLKDNLSQSTEAQALVAELRSILRSSGAHPKQYRIRFRSGALHISFYAQQHKKLLASTVSIHRNKRIKTVSHPSFWAALSAVVPVYFLSRWLMTLFSTGKQLTGQELIHLSTALLLCGISVPGILCFARNLRLRNTLSFCIHSVLSILVAVCLMTFESFLRSPDRFFFSWTNIFRNSGNIIRFPDQILVYWGVLLFANAFWNFKNYTHEQIRSTQLQSDLSGAQLKALEMQLHPHFLFNTLHVINGLILTNKSRAARMLTRLQHFLQMTLQSSDHHLVPFTQELKFLKCYLDIQKIRFGDRLNVKMEIDPEVLALPVPQLILQPIVENAIRHGLSCATSGGEIFLQARRQNGSLRIAIQDNGPGITASSHYSGRKKGVGLQNSALRLFHLYGNSQHFSYGNRLEGGFEVKMEIPLTR